VKLIENIFKLIWSVFPIVNETIITYVSVLNFPSKINNLHSQSSVYIYKSKLPIYR